MDSYNGLNSPTDWIMGEYNVALMTRKRYMRLVCLYWNKNVAYQLKMRYKIDTEHLEIYKKKKIIKVENDFIKISF
jgi:hypothetical protein